MRRLALAAALLACAASAAAQLYRWTDEKGKVHFGDTPPPADARDVRKKDVATGTSGSSESLPFALRQPMKDFPVTLYSAPSCESCGPARALLNARGVPFKEISVRTDEQIAELNRAAGGNVVPALLVGSTVIRGFEEGSYQRALDVAGYPKPGEVPARRQTEPKAQEAKGTDEKPAAPPPPAKKSPYYSSPEG
jgi:glutaredoxin